LKVVQALEVQDHKTKAIVATLKTLEVPHKVLLVDVPAKSGDAAAELDRNLVLATRNIEGVKLVPTREVTVYDLLNSKQVLLTEAAARKLSEALAV
jgi:large subunit ribosomal protein L4